MKLHEKEQKVHTNTDTESAVTVVGGHNPWLNLLLQITISSIMKDALRVIPKECMPQPCLPKLSFL